MWQDFDDFGKILAFGVIFTGVCFMLLTIPYWISVVQLSDSDTDFKAVKISLAVISAVLLFLLAICGIVGTFRKNVFCLKQYGCINIVMWLFTFILVILQYVTVTSCDTNNIFAETAFGGICDSSNDYLYWVPSLFILYLSSCAAFSGCGLCWKLKRNKPQEAGYGEYFG
eukprot:TRINITY_DN9570_c0_g1_i1.p1 TRINITY_DN9570_c0_g1~~TRINITY_DN9570_c0_g1_i1.p1  ORF type:complete len:170 (-),score=16.72 TRINITY_DN9570_c0_g1_i1:128-637(-)